MSQFLGSAITLESSESNSITRHASIELQSTSNILATSTTPASRIASDGVRSPVTEDATPALRKGRMAMVVAALAGTQFAASLCNAMIGIGAPIIAEDIGLDAGLLLWPVSVWYLACASLLLLAGAVADVLGHAKINLVGCLLVGVSTLASGFVRTGIQMIVLRAVSGMGNALCAPTSIAIVANNFKPGRARNIAFSCLGFSSPLGFSVGLILEGVLLNGPGWRAGLYLCGALNLSLFLLNLQVLPKDCSAASDTTHDFKTQFRINFQLLAQKIDWTGALIVCTSLAMLSYTLAYLSQDVNNIKQPSSISILMISLLLIPAFIYWQKHQEAAGKPALIPNSIWKNKVFTSVCLTVLFSYAVSNVMELFCNLFFQEVQGLSPLESSARIIPSLVVGVMLQLITGFFIHRLSPFHLVLIALILSAGAPLLMALTNPSWPYWYTAFPAQLLSPISVDLLFTIGLLVISAAFPENTQALAGAVFNTVVQFGSSLGLTIMQAISSSVTQASGQGGAQALERGYKASFWAAFGGMVFAVVVGAVGMRRMDRIGVKKD